MKVLQLNPSNAWAHYNLACAYSLRSGKHPNGAEGKKAQEADIAKALDHLERAIQSGWEDLEHLEQDSDLNPLRAEPRYKKILKER